MLRSQPYQKVVPLLAIMACCQYGNSQHLQFYRVTTEYAATESVKEKYSVLRSNPKVKHGQYTLYTDKGQLLEKGDYSDNLKGGIWEEYYTSGQLKSRGNYVHGVKVGQWDHYFGDGRLYEKFDLDKKRALYLDENIKNYVHDADSLDVIPTHPKGFFELDALLNKYILYPSQMGTKSLFNPNVRSWSRASYR